MDYSQLKKLDEESAKKMQEGTGPIDECICSLLSPHDAERKSIGASIKKAFASINPGKKKGTVGAGGNRGRGVRGGGAGGGVVGGGGAGGGGAGGGGVVGRAAFDNPRGYPKGKFDQLGFHSTKEVVKRKGSCGRCGCDKENFVLKHSYANIRITSPDVSSICPCPTNCLPEKTKLMNNIKVTVEHVMIDPDSENSEASLHHHRQQKKLREPDMTNKRSLNSLINAQYETDEDKLFD